MPMKKRLINTLLILGSLALLAACGNKEEATAEQVDVQIENLDDLTEDDTVSAVLQSTEYSEEDTVKVAVCGEPSSTILARAKESLQRSGYDLKVVSCDDFNEPNELLLSGEVDATFCEHEGYVTSYNKVNSTDLTIVERIYYQPMGIYSGKCTDLNMLNEGAVIAVPEGEVYLARALYLLEQKGYISINEEHGFQVTKEDITDNPKGLTIESVDMGEVDALTQDYDLVLVDVNRAMAQGIDEDRLLSVENRNSKMTEYFAICVVCRPGEADSDKLLKLCEALNSDAVEDYIEKEYAGSVVDFR